MRAIGRSVLVAALFISLVPVTASAQRYLVDFGVNGGGSWYSQMLDESEAGFEGARFRAGWLVGSQLTVWPWSRVGIRANGTYTDRPIRADEDVLGLDDGRTLYGNVNLWSGSGDLMWRFVRGPNETWQGFEALPYLALGAGAKWVNPAGDDQMCVDPVENKTWECAAIHPTPNVSLAVGERSVFMGLIGLGADFRLSPRTALRLEVNDRIWKPPVYRIDNIVGNQLVLANSDSRATNYIHEIGGQLGLHVLFGLRPPPVVAVAPPPAPPPPPPPPPAPEPPREDAIMVCVVDPNIGTGARMQSAVFRHEQRDTLVTIDGQRRPLTEVVPTGVRYARGADWLVRGEPLTLTVGRETVRWLPYQTAHMIQPDRVVYLGNVNGFPVYADRDEVADVIGAINTARAGRTDVELGTLLADNAQARNVLMDVAFLYTPLDPVGCVFQPLQRVVDVIKGKQN